MQGFISEDDLETFEGWLKYQAIDEAKLSPDECEDWPKLFEDARQRSAGNPKVGLMKLPSIPGEHRYAVAVREGSDLWLTLWVRRSPKGEFFIMVPRGDGGWNLHTSYHLDGTVHMKSHGRKGLPSQRRQALTGVFQRTESLFAYGGYFPKAVGAVCDPALFNGVVEVSPGVLGPNHGAITVDLVQPGHSPVDYPRTRIVTRQIFSDIPPWVVITVVNNPDGGSRWGVPSVPGGG